MPYDELVKRLRESKNEQCYIGCFGNCGDCKIDAVLEQAADAIEELQKAVNFHKFNSEFWEGEYNSLADEKWIPVTERLPDNEDMVIFHYAWTGRSGTVYKEVTLATLAELEQFGDKPLAWMPLPEPPKEKV